jgi:hypothetical protein
MNPAKRSEPTSKIPDPTCWKNESAYAHMSFTKRAAGKTAMTWTTGSKPKRISSAPRKQQSAPCEKQPPPR